MKGITIACICIPIISAIILGYLLYTKVELLTEFLSYVIYFLMAGIITPIGILVYAHLHKPHKDNLKEIYKRIHGELKDSLDSLDGTLDRTTIQYKINGKLINYKHIYMNHKVFEGLVNSGDFNQIDHKLQQPIQDIYGKIDIHDDYVKKIVELENGSTKEDEYVLILNGNEKELLSSIPLVMKELKKYF
jgi:predicted PurR-regulated permease PerM